MTKWKLLILLSCLAIFHAPDGKELRIDTAHVTAIRSAEAVKHHLTPGTNTIIYVTGQNFGVTETPEVVEDLIENCKD